MAGGLVGLLDDVAALAKLAAASIDDVGAAAGRASVKAAGVVVDDTAVTPAYVHGLAAERELPIIKRIALGSLKNKVLFILPAALLLSEFVPVLVEIILMLGGTFLSYEGAHKIHHRLAHHDADVIEVPAAAIDADQEEKTIASAIRTDFILSAEIMVIALKDVLDEGFVSRAVILLVVAFLITIAVYGVVALIVKMDDVGLRMVESGRRPADRIGRGLVSGMPKLLALLSVSFVGSALWVGFRPADLVRGVVSVEIPAQRGNFSPATVAIAMIGAVGGSLMNLAYPYFLEAKGWRGPQYRRVENHCRHRPRWHGRGVCGGAQ